jgi:DNA-binding NarL/FixJ family response regulator
MHTVRVVLADDHPLFLKGLELALENEGLEIAGLASSGEEVLRVVAEVAPDVVLLDVDMPGMGGLACLRRLRTEFPEVKVVMLSGHDDTGAINVSLDAGALCFVGKETTAGDIAHALRAVLASTVHFGSGSVTETLNRAVAVAPSGANPPVDMLTRREREILSLVATGLSNAALARKLWVTEQTVKFHLSNIYRKLDVENRTQAARRGTELGLVTDVDTMSLAS